MKFVTVAEARQNLTKLIAMIDEANEEVIITKNGKPVVLMKSISEDKFQLKPEGERKNPDGEGKRHL